MSLCISSRKGGRSEGKFSINWSESQQPLVAQVTGALRGITMTQEPHDTQAPEGATVQMPCSADGNNELCQEFSNIFTC